MVRIRYSIEGGAIKLGGAGGEIEIDDAELPEDPEAREEVISSHVQDEVENQVQWGWEEVR
jgi:hypothetical protein